VDSSETPVQKKAHPTSLLGPQQLSLNKLIAEERRQWQERKAREATRKEAELEKGDLNGTAFQPHPL
jgi:hypothetical protein